jgi:hypothetical protein
LLSEFAERTEALHTGAQQVTRARLEAVERGDQSLHALGRDRRIRRIALASLGIEFRRDRMSPTPVALAGFVEAHGIDDSIAHDGRETADERLLGPARERPDVAENALEHRLHDVSRAEPRGEPRPSWTQVRRQPLVHEFVDGRVVALREDIERFDVPLLGTLERAQERAFVRHKGQRDSGHEVAVRRRARRRDVSVEQGADARAIRHEKSDHVELIRRSGVLSLTATRTSATRSSG